MTEPRIRLLPSEARPPRGGRMPLGRALRWRSPMEATTGGPLRCS
jgi:hypothetical protein